MLFDAKATLLNVFVILLAIELQSKNGVSSEGAEGETTPSQPQQSISDSNTELRSENSAPTPSHPIQNESIPSTIHSNLTKDISYPENNTESVVKLNDNSTSSRTNNSKEIDILAEKGRNAEEKFQAYKVDSKTLKPHKFVDEIITNMSHNNSLVLVNFLNISSEKHDVLQLGERFKIDSIEKLEFNHETFSRNWKTTDFSNIKVYNNVLIEPVQYYNNFTCKSRKIEIVLNIIPENMTFIGDYFVRENTSDIIKSNGSFTFNQTGARLSYKFASLSELHSQQNSKEHANIIYENGQVKFSELCDNQCDLLITSAEMFEKMKLRILEELNHTWIVERTNQFTSVFPFLSLCSTPLPEANERKNNYYVIEKVVSKSYKSSNFKIGPMILKGLDNFIDGNVMAMKRRLPRTSNGFLLSALSSHVQGQCDWHYFSNISNGRPAIRDSFTFSIEEVRFSATVEFLDSWNMNSLEISLSQINIHRLDKSSPKILEFTKFMLQDFVHDTVVDSLKDLFIQRFPKMKIATTTTSTFTVTTVSSVKTTTKSKPTESREVIYWTTRRPRDWTDVSPNNHDHLPFPTRRVFVPCKDTRKWWQKLFYKNKCAQYKNSEHD